MLESVKIQRRQSEIRQELAGLVGKDSLTDDETRSMESLEAEYKANETRYRAALIAEDTERREAGTELETRDAREFDELLGRFEMRQVVMALDEGRQLDGATAEVVNELRGAGGYQGIPVPWAALEVRAGETIAGGTPNPISTAPIIDRIFPASVAARMGVASVNIGTGEREYPVTTSAVAAGWATTETGDVAGPTAFATTDRPLKPDSTLGVTATITRKALKQSGAALEQAVRRDMNGAIAKALDAAIFQGSGTNGEPSGVLTLAATLGITETDVSMIATYNLFVQALRRLMDSNAASSPDSVGWLVRPLTYEILDQVLITGTAVSEWDRLVARFGAGNFTVTDNALPPSAAEDATGKGAHTILATARTGGQAPIYLGTWGGIDLIRDPYTLGASGQLKVTALVTADVTISRAEQVQVLNNVQDRT